jgi:hypothetical protein
MLAAFSPRTPGHDEVSMKLADIEKGSDAAYQQAMKLILEEIEFELETCEILFGTDPKKVIELLAAQKSPT